MSNRTQRIPRVLRKARRLEKTDLDRSFDSALAELNRERTAAGQAAAKVYHEGLAALKVAHDNAKAEAAERFRKGRNGLLESLAKDAGVGS